MIFPQCERFAGGFKHFLFSIWDVILPIDELIFVQDGQNHQPVVACRAHGVFLIFSCSPSQMSHVQNCRQLILVFPRPSKGQVKLGRYTNSRPLPKDHRKPMVFIYINLYNGHVDLGNLGIYVNIYIRGNPPNPTYTPQPQQQQLRINQFQVYKCQDCLK